MAEYARTDELREAERRLQAAQLAGDVAALDQLLDDRLIFTYGPDGECFTKQDDLQAHRSRQQVLTKSTEEELTVLVEGRTGVTWFLGVLEGMLAGAPFAARLRYTRTWIHDDDRGWRIVAAHASLVAPPHLG
ncbi:MAG: nuclear transport factor 2 family protein [Pseudonocardia sp.]